MVIEKLRPQLKSDKKTKHPGISLFISILLIIAMEEFIRLLILGDQFNELIIPGGVIIIAIAGLFLLKNGNIDTFLNITLSIPLLIYIGSISGILSYSHFGQTLFFSAGWLLAGAFIFYFLNYSGSKTLLYLIFSLFTLIFQLLRADQIFNILSENINYYLIPILAFTLINIALLLLTHFLYHREKADNQEFTYFENSISEIIGGQNLPIIVLNIIRKDDGDIMRKEIININKAFENLFQVKLSEINRYDATNLFNLIFEESIQWNTLITADENESSIIFATEAELWFKVQKFDINNNQIVLIFEDITEEKKQKEELENSKNRYKVLLEAIPDMFFVIGHDGIIADFVIKEGDLFKIRETQIIGNNIQDAGFPSNLSEKILKCIHSCLVTNSIEVIEYFLNTPNGTYVYEMRLAKLNSMSVIAVSRDITRRKNAEFNLEKARKKAEESDRLKSAFLTNLSHEIRTPLNIITNLTHMLAEEDIDSEEKILFSDAIIQNGNQLMNMIDNTIHLAKIETDSIKVQKEFCHINELFNNVFNQFRNLIPSGRDVDFSLDLDVSSPSFGFMTDNYLLIESIRILVDNAIKYTLRGEIRIGYEMEGRSAVKFIISDTGIGIPQQEEKYIFSRFYRVKNHINDITSGSGIGLPIAQYYIKLLGGQLTFHSSADNGTTFTFTLPFKEGKGILRVVS